MKVNERMTTELVTVDPDATAMDAAEKMQSENVGTVLVTDDGRLKGLVTDRQIATKVVASGLDPGEVPVTDIMTRNPVTASPDMIICDATRIIGENGYRRVPIVEDDKVRGILSAADVVEHAKSCNSCTQNLFSEIAKSER